MRIFVINLARRTDRLAYMRQQLPEFERIDAIDGASVKDAAVARFRFWCAKGYGIRPGEIGCALSHQLVYRKLVAENIDYACVLEDDERLAGDFKRQIEPLGDRLKGKVPTVITLANTGAAYLINRSAAELLLKLNTPIRSTVDDWWRWERGGVNWQRVEGLVEVSTYGNSAASGIEKSDIIGDARQFIVNMSKPRLILHKLGRIIGKVLDW